jgi:hypothetical protein
LAVNYAAFSVVAIKGIQEQQKIIEKQETEIRDLKKRLDHAGRTHQKQKLIITTIKTIHYEIYNSTYQSSY